MVPRTASFGAGPGTTTRGTCDPRTGTGSTRRTATTTSGFAAPELTRGLDGPHLNRPAFAAFPRVRQNTAKAGVLVEGAGGTTNARRLPPVRVHAREIVFLPPL